MKTLKRKEFIEIVYANDAEAQHVKSETRQLLDDSMDVSLHEVKGKEGHRTKKKRARYEGRKERRG